MRRFDATFSTFALPTSRCVQTRADLAAGRMVQESPEAHLARLDAM